MRVERWLNKVWYERGTPPRWLLPLARVFGVVTRVRRWAYAMRASRADRIPCPIIVIGNLSVGGTGKTPLVGWLVERLEEAGFRPGIASRGYRGAARTARIVGANADPRIVGDEAVLLARRTKVPVAIGAARGAAVSLLIDEGCNVIVSDDGLQHYALARDCEIVVIDGERGFGNGCLLPAGPLREPRGRLAAADAVVINGGDIAIEGAFRMRLAPISAVSLYDGSVRALSEFSGRSVHAVAAIGNPQRFFGMLRDFGIDVIDHARIDHADYDRPDIDFGDDKPVLMTEKDAVKCVSFADARHWSVPVTVRFDGTQSQALLDIVLRKTTACLHDLRKRAHG